jgi:hypothetical protein
MQPAAGDPSLITTGQEYRNYTTSLLSAVAGLTFSGGGVPDAGWSAGANTGSMTVVQHAAGANFSVDVAAGWAFVSGSDVTSQGVYACWNDAVVNVATPSAPASGSRTHRLILQIQDKLENGTWTGYQAQFVLLQDTGSGTPSVGASAITLALITIASGQASVTNSNIADYRRSVGPVNAVKTADLAKTGTSLADDPDLQLWGLANSAWYHLHGEIYYKGGSGASEGDIKWTFRTGGSAGSGGYSALHTTTGGSLFGTSKNAWGDTVTAQTQGTSNDLSIIINGSFGTGGTAPNNFAVFQWALNSSNGTTTVEAGSFLRAVRVA